MKRHISAPLLFFAMSVVQQAIAQTADASGTQAASTIPAEVTILENALAAASTESGDAAITEGEASTAMAGVSAPSNPSEPAAPSQDAGVEVSEKEAGDRATQDTAAGQAEQTGQSQPHAASASTAASQQVGKARADEELSAAAHALTQEATLPQASGPSSAEQTTLDILPPEHPTGLRASDQTERMVAAARQVLEQTSPVALGKAGRVIVTYGEALPVLVCTPLAICAVELEKGENLVDAPVLGDPVRWTMSDRQVIWPGQESQWIFMFKPSDDADRMSTAVFVTDRRVYSIVLKRHPYEYIPILSFDYPDTRHRLIAEKIEADRAARLKAEADALKRKADAAAAAAARATRTIKASGTQTSRGLVPAEKLDFNYQITGRAAFKPTQVYNDGRKTYVVLPASYRGSTPVLLAGSGASNKAINISFKDGRYVIDRLVSSFTLQDGSKTITVKRITP